jgi:hypothetical protein
MPSLAEVGCQRTFNLFVPCAVVLFASNKRILHKFNTETLGVFPEKRWLANWHMGNEARREVIT